MSHEAVIAVIREKLAEAKALISSSSLDATAIGQMRMKIWRCERLLDELDRAPQGGAPDGGA